MQNLEWGKGNPSIIMMSIQISRARVLIQKNSNQGSLGVNFFYLGSPHGYLTKCHLILFKEMLNLPVAQPLTLRRSLHRFVVEHSPQAPIWFSKLAQGLLKSKIVLCNKNHKVKNSIPKNFF